MIDASEWYRQTNLFSKDLEACNMPDAKVLWWTYACIQVLEYQVWSNKSNVRSKTWI
jgi:hypothetical protein